MAMLERQPVSRLALADAVYDRLLEMIMEGSLAPGVSLRTMALAESIGTSATPVREALARLEGQGLVERAAMRGFSVAHPLSGAEIDMLMQTRLLIEPEIAADAAQNAPHAVVEALKENVRASRKSHVGRQFEQYREYLDLSAEFHHVISQACENRFLREALAALPIHVQRFRLFGDEGVTDVDVSLDEHEAILKTMQNGDPEGARSAMVEHIRNVHTRTSASLTLER